MVLEIVKYPHPVLKTQARPVEKIDDTIHRLIENMIDTMRQAPGIGLAAPQVGESKQVMIADISSVEPHNDLIVLINPQIADAEGEMVGEEGCLSILDFMSEIKRYARVKVCGLNREGEMVEIMGEGLLARVLQHEIDHLNGILILDRVSSLKRNLYKMRLKKWMREGRED
ncbi:MAG TPA: peptide deformylase [Syntrophaceae bacterium]|nr:peptide deformylase [Syntrophaceae bacterium]